MKTKIILTLLLTLALCGFAQPVRSSISYDDAAALLEARADHEQQMADEFQFVPIGRAYFQGRADGLREAADALRLAGQPARSPETE